MSLQTRLGALITAIGADIKELKARGKGSALSASSAVGAGSSYDPIAYTYIAQRFTATRSGVLSLLKLDMKRDAAVGLAGSFNVFIYNAGPTGLIESQIGYYGAIQVTDIGTALTTIIARKNSNAEAVTLAAGSRYYVVLRAIQQTLNGGSIYWRYDNGGGDQTTVESNDGITWGTRAAGHALSTYVSTPAQELTSDGVSDLLRLSDSLGAPLGWIDAVGKAGGVLANKPPFVTALPTIGPDGGPLVDGQECVYLPDPANATGNGGVAWHLKYRAAETGTYKWYCIGQAPLHSATATEEGHLLATYAALGAAGPSVTVPLAGDYMVEVGAASYTPGNNSYSFMSYDIGATAAVDADAYEVRGTGSGNVPQTAGSRARRKNGLAAGAALVAKYRCSVAGGCWWKNRWMNVTPIRVG